MAKRIVIDPFDPASVSKAITELHNFKNWLEAKVIELCLVLAKDYALKTVADDYGYTEGGNIACYVEEVPDGYRIVAEGKPVFFLEYGTGELAGTGEYLGKPPVATHPGSYSDSEGKKTWFNWTQGDMVEPYKYTHAPRSGMYFAFRAVNDNVQKVAMEVFRT